MVQAQVEQAGSAAWISTLTRVLFRELFLSGSQHFLAEARSILCMLAKALGGRRYIQEDQFQ